MKLVPIAHGERARIACAPQELDVAIALALWLFAGRCKLKAVDGGVAYVVVM